ncbi:MAG: hypothetical protein AB8G05_10525 [Oligoflexales bacterium]
MKNNLFIVLLSLVFTVQCAHELEKVEGDGVPDFLSDSKKSKVQVRVGIKTCQGVVVSENAILLPALCIASSQKPIIRFPDGSETTATIIATKIGYVLVNVKYIPEGMKPIGIGFDSKEFYLEGKDDSWWRGQKTPVKENRSIQHGQAMYASNGNILGFHGYSLLNKENHQDSIDEWNQVNRWNLVKLFMGLKVPNPVYRSSESNDSKNNGFDLSPIGVVMKWSYLSYGIGANFHSRQNYGYHISYSFQPAKEYDDIFCSFSPYVGLQSLYEYGPYPEQRWWTSIGIGVGLNDYFGCGIEMLSHGKKNIYQFTWDIWAPILSMMDKDKKRNLTL